MPRTHRCTTASGAVARKVRIAPPAVRPRLLPAHLSLAYLNPPCYPSHHGVHALLPYSVAPHSTPLHLRTFNSLLTSACPTAPTPSRHFSHLRTCFSSTHSSPTPTPTPSRIHHLLPKDSPTLWRRRTIIGATCAEADDVAEVCERQVAAAGCPMTVLFPSRRAAGGSDALWLWMG
ncbi:unnamed protein product [Closterium sp. Naga37s-1]|nr:unnamed protein product [Closterium sp. Naga37s-1]